jgi:hypothetical protein
MFFGFIVRYMYIKIVNKLNLELYHIVFLVCLHIYMYVQTMLEQYTNILQYMSQLDHVPLSRTRAQLLKRNFATNLALIYLGVIYFSYVQ